ncbi:hypothetical protein VIOR103205_10595 [Vibrio ordalii]
MQEKLQLLEQIKATNFNELACRLWVIKKNTYKGIPVQLEDAGFNI